MRRFTAATLRAAAASRALSFEPRTREYDFLFGEVLEMYAHYEGGAAPSVDREMVEVLTRECAKLSTARLFPLLQSGDEEGCTLLPGGEGVKTPSGFREAYRDMIDGGWIGVSQSEEYGGQGLPQSVGFITRELMGTANWSLMMYAGLSQGCMATIETWGSDEQKKMYLSKLASGEWSGTMCLTEPQCGTDLAQVRTKAVPHADGTYRLTGTKIFISAGEHDMTENIAHIVLARLPDSPPGTKGISLFLVPRHVPKADGTLAKERNLTCSGLESKMGIKANATCQMSFEDSVGYIIGKPNDGLKQMFTFMNGARLGTSIQGVCHAELAFQNALLYARERCSMRALSGTKEPSKVADPIIYHPNVRHNILFAKAVAEGGRCFLYDIARMLDNFFKETDDKKKQAINDEIGFYTPVAKAFLTELGLEAANCGVQVFGGHGYIRGNGMEQIVRDARISTLYEGTTGVQALDFIGRKVLKSKTNEVMRFGARVNKLCMEHMLSFGTVGQCSRKLWVMEKKWRMTTAAIGINALSDREAVGAASQDFLMYSGYLIVGYYWLRMAAVAQKKINANQDPDGYYQAKVDTCKFYFSRMLPRILTHSEIALQTAESLQNSKESTWNL